MNEGGSSDRLADKVQQLRHSLADMVRQLQHRAEVIEIGLEARRRRFRTEAEETKPEETKPEETKPEETKLEETKKRVAVLVEYMDKRRRSFQVEEEMVAEIRQQRIDTVLGDAWYFETKTRVDNLAFPK